MDAETQLAIAGRDKVRAMLDEAHKKLSDHAAASRAKAVAMAENANRHKRRKVAIILRRLDDFERSYHQRIDQQFANLTRGFDMDACTWTRVQDDAAAGLAGIFS